MADPEEEVAKRSYFEYDDIFKYVKPFSRYQMKVVFGTCLILAGQNIQFAHLIVVTGTPNFQCATENVTCGGVNRCCANCTSYEFETLFTTIVSEWNMICDRAYLSALIQSMFFVGMLVGSFVSGILSDAFGRRTVIFGSLGVMASCGLIQSFVDCPSFLALLRFGNGSFMISATLSQYILMMEFIGPDYRTMAGNMNGYFWMLGSCMSIFIAYFVRDWRTFSWITSLFPFLLYLSWRVFPESPRWHVAHGNLEQAHQTIMKFGGHDDKTVDSEFIMSKVQEIRDDQVVRKKEGKKHTPLDLLRTPKLRRWTIIICFGWFTVSMIGFGIFMFVTNLPGDLYVNMTIRMLLTSAFIPITWYLMRTIGRRLVHCTFMILTGVLFLLILAVPKGHEMAITWLALVGFSVVNMEWSSVYLITTELFPTVLRNTAQGVGSTAARFGGIAAPFLLMLAQLPGSSILLPMAIFGACAIACGIVSLWLPETALVPLHQTIAETEGSPEDYGIPFLKKRKMKAEDHEMEHLQKPSEDKGEENDEN